MSLAWLAPLNPFAGGVDRDEFEEEPLMRFRVGLSALAVVLSLASPVRAEDCPVKTMDLDDIIAALKAAPGCDAAVKLFEACAFGASGDIDLGDAVEKKCEADFLPRLTALKKSAYENQLGRCNYKYRNKQGTMWRSATAFCRAEISQRYARGKGK
jgi:hypothetical protein